MSKFLNKIVNGDCLKELKRIPDNSFDLVVCSEVLEHLHEYKDAIAEISRVLKTGGSFLASVPAELPEKICWALSKDYQNQPGGHLRIFNKKCLIEDISQNDLQFEYSEAGYILNQLEHIIQVLEFLLWCVAGVKSCFHLFVITAIAFIHN